MKFVIEIPDPTVDITFVKSRLENKMEHRQALEQYPVVMETITNVSPTLNAYAYSSSTSGLIDLNRVLIDLSANTRLEAPEPDSKQPIFGPLLIFVRRWMHRWLARWFIDPVMEQQSEINTSLVSVVGEIELWQQLHANQVNQLQQRIEHLETLLAEQQGYLPQLQSPPKKDNV